MLGHAVLATVTALSAVLALGATVAAAPAIEGYCLTYRAPAETVEATLDAAADVLDDRLGAMGIAGDAITDPGSGTISVLLKPGPTDLVAASELAAGLGATAELTFMPVPLELQGLVGEGPLPAGMADIEPLFTGTEIASAAVVTDDTTGELLIDLLLEDTAARLFDEYAADHYGEQFAIVLDGQILSAPAIRANRFDGRAQISGGAGGFGPDEAQALVAAIVSGAMPVELVLDDVRMCPVSADLIVQTPVDMLARAGEDLEWPAMRVVTLLRDLGLDDFVITLQPETERITVTILSADPATVGPVEGALSADWLGDGVDLAFTDDTLDAFLESLPDQPVALRWSDQVPHGTEWQAAKGAIIGDPSDLGTGEPAGVDVEAVVETYDRWEAFDTLFTKVTDDPHFVGILRIRGRRDGPAVHPRQRPDEGDQGTLRIRRPGVPGLWRLQDPRRRDRPHPH